MFGRRLKAPILHSTRLEKARRRSQLCVDRIKQIHRGIILGSGNTHEIGLEDVIYNDMGIQRVCDAMEFEKDPFRMAAIALESIAVFHPFAEGNKRTAFAVAVSILHDSGYRLSDDLDTSSYVIEVSMGMHDVDEIAQWFRENVV